MTDELLKAQEVAKLFKCSPPTIYKWKDKGVLPFVMIEGSVRFIKREMYEVIEKNHRKSTSDNSADA